jgi:purine-cytosine permease-like protein
MVFALGLGGGGALLMVLAAVTTNFVNIYLSALAWKSLAPAASSARSVWAIGLIGAGLSLFSRAWLDRYADFMVVLGSLLVPVGGVLLARFFLVREPVEVADLYDRRGHVARARAAVPGLTAWALGAAVYHLAGAWGGTLAALATAAVAYLLLARLEARLTRTTLGSEEGSPDE